MFALLAVIAFVILIIDPTFLDSSMLPLGLAFLAFHLFLQSAFPSLFTKVSSRP